MKTSRSNKQGLAHLGILAVVVLALGVIGSVGWYVYSKNKSLPTKSSVSAVDKAAEGSRTVQAAKPEYKPPEGWVQYKHTDLPLTLYYPKDWSADGFTITAQGQTDLIKQGLGNAVGYQFNAEANKWEGYFFDPGSDARSPYVDNEGKEIIKSTKLAQVSEYPIAYFELGHAIYETHGILVINEDKAYYIRLPGVNGYDSASDTWLSESDLKARYEAEAVTLPDIIKSIRFKE